MSRAVDNGGSSPEITIDRKADVPVGVQLGWALHAQIRDGRFAPGARLPTLRELAEATGLNVNTVRSVYRRLEQQGLIESQQGSGTFVAATPYGSTTLSSIAAHAAEEARETGLDPREVAAALYVAPDAAPAPDGQAGVVSAERSEQERRQTLRRQIAAFERTLADLEAEHPGIAPGLTRARRGIGPALLTADELTGVRAALIRRLTVVQAAIDEHVEGERRERIEAIAPARKTSKAKQPTVDASKRTARARPTARPAPAS
jgi:DNA-binding transcriptional regulator YhcF (GntR family)